MRAAVAAAVARALKTWQLKTKNKLRKDSTVMIFIADKTRSAFAKAGPDRIGAHTKSRQLVHSLAHSKSPNRSQSTGCVRFVRSGVRRWRRDIFPFSNECGTKRAHERATSNTHARKREEKQPN